MIWTPYDWLNKLYGCYVTALVGIVSRCGFTIETGYGNQSNKSKLALYVCDWFWENLLLMHKDKY